MRVGVLAATFNGRLVAAEHGGTIDVPQMVVASAPRGDALEAGDVLRVALSLLVHGQRPTAHVVHDVRVV